MTPFFGDGKRPVDHARALLTSLSRSLVRRKISYFRYDSDGDWVNQEGRDVIVSPVPHTTDLREVDELARDLWCHFFTPCAGAVVFDVGAGIGEETLHFSKLVGTSGKVISIEAHPRTYRCLTKSVALSKLTNVQPLFAAVTDQPGVLRLQENVTHIANRISQTGGGALVPALSLKELLGEAPPTSPMVMLKMNIEGAELPSLRGAMQHLRAFSHLVISCHDFVDDAPAELRTYGAVRELLEGLGFSVRTRPTDPRPWVRYYLYAERRA